VIRRDYLLRQIQQFVAMLAKITGLTKAEIRLLAGDSICGCWTSATPPSRRAICRARKRKPVWPNGPTPGAAPGAVAASLDVQC